MTAENLEKILKKVKKNTGIPETVSVYDEHIAELTQDAIIDMRTGGVPQSIIDEMSPPVITAISHYVGYEMDGEAGNLQRANWHLTHYNDRVRKLSLEKPGATLGGFV